MNWRDGLEMLKQAAADFSKDDAWSHAAALAFYAALGLAPTILLTLTVTAFLGEGTKQAMINELRSLVGDRAGESIEVTVRSAEEQPEAGIWAALLGFLTMLWSASGIFAQLQAAMNDIWEVELRPDVGWRPWIRTRLLSMGLVFSTLFLLLVSLAINAAINFLMPGVGPFWNLLHLLVSILIFSALFALIFKFLPDATIQWSDVWFGAVITALLFALGKYGIGLYLGNSTFASAYGAAGSLVILLVWVYYSALILFYGAEITQVHAQRFGYGIQPADYATMAPVAPQESKVASPPSPSHVG